MGTRYDDAIRIAEAVAKVVDFAILALCDLVFMAARVEFARAALGLLGV